MAADVAYSDIPPGFQIGGQQQSYTDIPQGFQVGGQTPRPSPFGSNRGVNIPPPSTVTPDLGELAKSFISDASQLPGTAGDIGNFIVHNAAKGAARAYQLAGGDVSPEMAEAITNMNGIPSTADTYKSLGIPVHDPQGFSGLFGSLLGQGFGIKAMEKAAPAIIDSAKAIPEGIALRVKGMQAMKPDEIASQSDKNWQEASDMIKHGNSQGAVFTPEASQGVIPAIQKAWQDNNFAFSARRHPDTVNAIADLQDDIANGKTSLADFDKHRQALNDVIKDNTTKLEGTNSDGTAALLARKSLENYMISQPESSFVSGSPQAVADLRTGLNQWAQAARYDRLGEMGKDAQNNPDALMRGAQKILKNTKGLSQDEIDTLNALATRNKGQSIERGLGTAGFDFGKVKNITLPGLLVEAGKGAATASFPHALPLVTAGTILRQTGKLAAKGKYQNALDAIMNRNTNVTPPASSPPFKPAGLLPPPESVINVNPQGQAIAMTAATREQLGQSPSTLSEQTPAKNLSDQEYAAQGAPGTLQRELGTKRMLGSASIGIPAATGGAAAATQQILQKPQFPQQPQQKPQSSLPDISKFIKAESGGNPNAKNPNSSASGLLQFTKDTWAQMVGKYGKSTGITLQDKDNPEAQRIMGQLYAQDNAKYLNSKLDRPPTNGEIYMAHFLGPQGAVKLIQAQGTGKQAIMLFPRSNVDANRQIFFSKGQPRTVEDVYALLEKKVA